MARPDLNTCVVMINKAGSTSFESSLSSHKKGKMIHGDDAQGYSKRVMFIREPLARHQSAFSFFWWLKDEGHVTSIFDLSLFKGKSLAGDYAAFVDFSLENGDSHWNPQVGEASDNGTFIPNIVHRFEDLTNYWETYFTGRLPWDNAFSKVATTDYRRGDLVEFYRNDTSLWENTNGT